MKAMNSNLEVTISFGGWNQGPGDQNLDCYEISGCYARCQWPSRRAGTTQRRIHRWH